MDRKEIFFLLNYLENNMKELNSLQHKFINSLKVQYRSTGVLTQRQVESLYAIKEHIPSPAMEKSVNESDSDTYHAQYSSFDSTTLSYNVRI
jgi:hypothetical protein